MACGLLSSCGVQVFFSCGAGSRLCSLRHVGSLVEAHELSCCGAWALLPCCTRDLNSPTRDRTHLPCIGRQILYHWTTREVPTLLFFKIMPHRGKFSVHLPLFSLSFTFHFEMCYFLRKKKEQTFTGIIVLANFINIIFSNFHMPFVC